MAKKASESSRLSLSEAQAIMNWERQGDDRLVQFYQDWGLLTK